VVGWLVSVQFGEHPDNRRAAVCHARVALIIYVRYKGTNARVKALVPVWGLNGSSRGGKSSLTPRASVITAATIRVAGQVATDIGIGH